ncbi:MAG: matrixin family metalloprotease [Elusimicrobia bacterium]|nr:matrixin family metalloprotease [Elusimicrobiota bacterium]
MRTTALAAAAAVLLAGVPRFAAAGEAGGAGPAREDYAQWPYPDFVVLSVLPRNMWAASPRTPGPGGAKILLTYRFLDGPPGRRRISACPDPLLFADPQRRPPCIRFHEAAAAVLRRWAEASGHVELAPAGEGERADITIGWTALEDPGLVVFNSSDPEHSADGRSDYGAQGFERAHLPTLRVRFATLFINSGACMYLDERSECPAGQTAKRAYPFAGVALHEAGHALGLAHFYPTAPTIMAEDSAFTDLQDADRRAVRDYYDRASAAVR